MTSTNLDLPTLVDDPIFNSRFLRLYPQDILKSVLNIYAATVNISLFYRKKSKLNGAPFLNGVSELFEDCLRSLSIEEFCIAYNQYLGLSSPHSNIKIRLKNWIKTNRIPFPVIRIISLIKKDDGLLIQFIKMMSSITDRTGKSRFVPPLILSDALTPQTLYDIGLAMGDGGLFNQQQQITDGAQHGEELALTYKFLAHIKKFKIHIWGLNKSSISLKEGKGINKNLYRLTVSNKWFVNYLNFVYGMPFGDKIKQNLRVPPILDILPLNRKYYLLSYLYRGLFDSDGHHSYNSSLSTLYTASGTLKNQLIDFLKFYNVSCSSGSEEIRILSNDYRKFAYLVGSSHFRKIRNMIVRLSIPPKSYALKMINLKKLDRDGNFDFKNHILRCRMTKMKLPQKPTKTLMGLVKYLIPQADGNKCLIKKESNNLSEEEFKQLVNTIESYFRCKVKKNPTSGAYMVHSSRLTKFLKEFFIYQKSWEPLNIRERTHFYNQMIGFLEVDK